LFLVSQKVEDIAILRVTNGNDYFCMVNASLTADTCAAVCSAYARLGARKSDMMQAGSAEDSPSRPTSLPAPTNGGTGSPQRGSQRMAST
jgi:hypothetical protein